EEISRGGIVRDERLHEKAVESIRHFVALTPGWAWQGLIPSPIKGTDGNQEFLAWLVREA
ncbi:MAG TPA: TlyA family rRNA (cytidine-2'-O)-methyltransferase, partial [Luteolibacter sp.]|nr:TlyA family rRNA (cytidine-2'-O)-methyltransferase [Luteolibacter sp.]